LKRGFAIAIAAALLLATACGRKDAYSDWKAPQLLDQGEKLLRANDLPGAYNFFKRGYEKLDKTGPQASKAGVFVDRMLFISAALQNVPELEKQLARFGGLEPQTMNLRLALHLAILMQRAGRLDDARALAEKIAVRLASRAPELEEIPFHAIGWIVVDRVRSANVELTRAKAASDAFTGAFTDIAGTAINTRQPLNPGLRAWIARYVDHLYDTERTLVAQAIGDLVERIDEVAPSSDDKDACLLLDPFFPTLGCLADWK
jgi:hypothetical protein